MANFQPSLAQLLEAEDECLGFCEACGNDQSGVEPDAEGYRCESCGALTVHGTIYYAMSGQYHMDGEDKE